MAKELGVKSASIVKKCADEGLDVKNHMSVIKAGLAATIREWFSEGENVTTVETADKVDLKKVRIKKKKAAKKAAVMEETVARRIFRSIGIGLVAKGGIIINGQSVIDGSFLRVGGFLGRVHGQRHVLH